MSVCVGFRQSRNVDGLVQLSLKTATTVWFAGSLSDDLPHYLAGIYLPTNLPKQHFRFNHTEISHLQRHTLRRPQGLSYQRFQQDPAVALDAT
jgi:hypothetical protein